MLMSYLPIILGKWNPFKVRRTNIKSELFFMFYVTPDLSNQNLEFVNTGTLLLYCSVCSVLRTIIIERPKNLLDNWHGILFFRTHTNQISCILQEFKYI